MSKPKGGVCCSCSYKGEQETPCPKREDKIHCEHWWDGTYCTFCNGTGKASSAHSANGSVVAWFYKHPGVCSKCKGSGDEGVSPCT